MTCRHVFLAVAISGSILACSSSQPPANGAVDSGTGSGTLDAASSDAASGSDTWASYASGFFTTYCTSCHDAQDPTGRDFTVQANVAKEPGVMRCGVSKAQDPSWSCPSAPPAKQFPIGSGPKPSDAERDRIVAWITAGEP